MKLYAKSSDFKYFIFSSFVSELPNLFILEIKENVSTLDVILFEAESQHLSFFNEFPINNVGTGFYL